MTESEIQDIVVRVLDEIRSDSVTIEELLHTNVLKGEDLVELNKGRRTSLLDIKEYLDQNEERCIEVLKKGDKDLPTDNNVFSALRTLTEIANNNEVYKKYVDEYYRTLAMGIYNLQYAYDPSMIIIGGAISSRSDLLDKVNEQLDIIFSQLTHAHVRPNIKVCQFGNDANLIGATYHYIQRH